MGAALLHPIPGCILITEGAFILEYCEKVLSVGMSSTESHTRYGGSDGFLGMVDALVW